MGFRDFFSLNRGTYHEPDLEQLIKDFKHCIEPGDGHFMSDKIKMQNPSAPTDEEVRIFCTRYRYIARAIVSERKANPRNKVVKAKK